MDTPLLPTAPGDIGDEDSSGRLSSNYEKLAMLFSLTQKILDSDVAATCFMVRMQLADGMLALVEEKFVLEGEERLTVAFSAFFCRCTVLWKLLLQERKNCYSQRLILKLDYSQRFMSKIFSIANLNVKLSMGAACNMGTILDLCVAILQLQGICVDC